LLSNFQLCFLVPAMSKSVTARYLSKSITVERALEIREREGAKKGGTLSFFCEECDGLVWPHNAGGNAAAHFEHLVNDPECSLCQKYRKTKVPLGDQYFDVDDKRAIEGQAKDAKILLKKRNRAIAIQCKVRDGCQCRACGFKLEIQGKYVIECHHLNPISVVGEGEVLLKDLVSLCPTCHRIAHTRLEPIPILALKRLVGDFWKNRRAL
jgi:hypothetical protein